MRPIKALSALAVLGLIAACVTINVYFPAAAAEDAADRFIQTVLGEEEAPPAIESENDGSNPQSFRFDPLSLLIPVAHAQTPNIDIDTPQIQAIEARMKSRFDGQLRGYFDSGAIGFTSNAMIEIRDLKAVGLAARSALKAAVTEDNNDRSAVYREIAVANGHPEWESDIRDTFARRWVAQARAGWYYQDATGNWVQK